MHALLTAPEEARYAELQGMALEAARVGDTELLTEMIRYGLPANLSDHKGNSLLMLASYHGHAYTCERLLTLGAEVDRTNDRGQSPLAGVAFKGDVPVAEVLLRHGANPEAAQGMGMTPYRFACMFGRTDVVALFDRAGPTHTGRRWLWVAAARWTKALSWLWPKRKASTPLKAMPSVVI